MTPNQEKIYQRLRERPDYLYGIMSALKLARSTVDGALKTLRLEKRIKPVKSPPHEPAGPERKYYRAI